MRKKGLVFLLILFLIITVLLVIFTDRWLESEMESFGSAFVGATVEFDNVDFSLLNLHLKWDSLQVTDPNNTWNNLFQAGITDFDLQLVPLLSGKVIVNNIMMEGIRFNTRRQAQGRALSQEERAEQSEIAVLIREKLETEAAQMPVFNLSQFSQKINVDSLWNLVNLQTPDNVDSLADVFRQDFQGWEERIESLPSQKDLSEMTRKVENIQPEKINTVEEFQSTLQQVNQVYQNVDSLYNSVKTLKSEFSGDVSRIKQTKTVVSDWIRQDYQKAINMAKIPDLSVKNVARILFGERIIRQVQMVLSYIGTARYYAEQVKSVAPKKENPPRLEGQTVYFSPREAQPKFWIKQISLSGQILNDMNLSGKVNDIVSRQTVIGKPTTIEIRGSRQDQRALNLMATLDYREDLPHEKIELQLQQIPLASVKLTDFPLLPYKIEKGSGEIQAELNFKGPEFLTNIRFDSRNLSFDFSDAPEKMDERLAKLSRSIVQSLNAISFDATIKRTPDVFNFRVNSNIDNLIADRMKSILSDEIQKARNQIESRVKEEVDEYRQKLDSLVNNRESELRDRIEKVEREIEQRKKLIADKRSEIENRINARKQELKKKAEEEAKKKLKDIF
ncbi:MAG: TIGR03545 family protein [Calditrichaeota bacterium]|nr:TIGR03545 family protein [Calditrichota bacterium]